MKTNKPFLIAMLAILSLVITTGCTSIATATKKSELKINSKLTKTIFLDPVAPAKRTVFLQFRNNSDSESFNIQQQIKSKLEGNGYTIIEDPEQATYWLQANVRYVGPPEGSEFENVFEDYMGAAEGAAAGVALSEITGGSGNGNVKAAFIGALIGYAADAMVDDVFHAAITDLQISKKVENGTVESEEKHRLSQGESGRETQKIKTTTNRKKYQTRVLMTANQANMDIPESELVMQKRLTKVISGLF